MAISKVAVNYSNVFANGTITVAGATWSDEERLADYFINRLATTTAAPAGQVTIVIDQGATTRLNANRLIIPALHNLDVALTLAYNSTDSWPGTTVTLSPSATPTTGTLFSATFPKVTGGAGNQFWRLSFTKTDEALQIPEIWLTEKIELGESETGSEDGGVDQPVPFDISPNILEQETVERVRSAVTRGQTLRGPMILRANARGGALSASAYLDWKGLVDGTEEGLRHFFIDDPLGDTWFASMRILPGRDLSDPERWNIEIEVMERP